MLIRVTDPLDPRLDDYRDLRHREPPPGVVVAESVPVVERLLASSYAVRSVVVTPARLPRLEGAAAAHCLLVVDQPVLDAVAGYHVHRGALAAGDRGTPADALALAASAQRIVVVERLTDHENLGAVFRSAAAFGVDAVLICPQTCDPLYRRCVRVSMGHALRLPFARLHPWPDSLDELAALGFTVVALTPDPQAEPLARGAVDHHGRVAVMVGSEGPGLSAGAMAAAAHRVRIPMAPGVDSLNVAAAAAIAFYSLFPL
jgi:tRNA G18 (ribose-2'-O)-methylase SpoU